MAKSVEKRLFTTAEAAEWLGVGVYFVRKLVRDGSMRLWRHSPANEWLITVDELERVASDAVRVSEINSTKKISVTKKISTK